MASTRVLGRHLLPSRMHINRSWNVEVELDPEPRYSGIVFGNPKQIPALSTHLCSAIHPSIYTLTDDIINILHCINFCHSKRQNSFIPFFLACVLHRVTGKDPVRFCLHTHNHLLARQLVFHVDLVELCTIEVLEQAPPYSDIKPWHRGSSPRACGLGPCREPGSNRPSKNIALLGGLLEK